ncbi:MAG: SpoIIE family protein phosphatase [Clostridia bacterium]|nr:SpoIIE family protein phosphatase [Clostridia bacterium]
MSVLQKNVEVIGNGFTAKNVFVFLVKHLAFGMVGFLFSLSGFNGEFSPFGVAFVAGVPQRFNLSTALGVCVGYFVSLDSLNALRYVSTILALCVILGALKVFKQIRSSIYTPVVSAFLCILVTGLALVFSGGINTSSVVLTLSESVIGGGCAYLFARSCEILSVKGGLKILTSKKATSLVISLSLLLLSLRELSLAGVYPVHIITSVFILVCGFYAKEAGGTIVGVCTGVALGLSTGDITLITYYSLGGLLSGAFSSLGRIASFLAFSLSGLAVLTLSENLENTIPLVVETIASGVIFIGITLKFNKQLESVFLPSVVSPVIESVKNDIVSKLKKASEASTEICSSLTDVNRVLEKQENSDVKLICKKTREHICGSCGLYDVCWGEGADQTDKMFVSLLELKKNGIYLEYKTLPQQFTSACIRSENVASCFNKMYTEYRIRESNQNRVREIYKLASEQFINVSSLLDSLCDGINDDVKFDMDTAAMVRSAAVSCGFEPIECCCVINTMEKMSVELRVRKPYDKASVKALSEHVKIICKRNFELPETEQNEVSTRFIYKEKAEYKIVSAGVQFNANGEKYSGDSFTTFQDNNGYFYGIICDGMGTGTKAALSSNLAVSLLEKLIKSGFGINASINTVNTSLISKSGDECSVTLDMVVFDLFTGRAEFYKCGASDTVVKRNGKITDVGFCSVPLGILGNVETGTGSGMLGNGDIILMHSDGVREEDEAYLKKQLKKFSNGNVRNFTTELCENIRRTQPEKNDDMTVLTLAVTKND